MVSVEAVHVEPRTKSQAPPAHIAEQSTVQSLEEQNSTGNPGGARDAKLLMRNLLYGIRCGAPVA